MGASHVASASVYDQTSGGRTVVVENAYVPEGGFVTIHDGSLLDGEALGSVRGTSDYLEAEPHSNIEIELDDPYEEDGTVIAIPHRDTNGNWEYDFVDSEGGADAPYLTEGGDAVVADASLTVESMDEETDDGGMTGETDTSDGVGFGAVVALVAVAGAVLAARRPD